MRTLVRRHRAARARRGRRGRARSTCARRATRRASSTPRASTRSARSRTVVMARRPEASPRDVAARSGRARRRSSPRSACRSQSVAGLAPREGRSPRFPRRPRAEGHQRLRPAGAQHRQARERDRGLQARQAHVPLRAVLARSRDHGAPPLLAGPHEARGDPAPVAGRELAPDPPRLGRRRSDAEGGRAPEPLPRAHEVRHEPRRAPLRQREGSLGLARAGGVRRLLGARPRLVDLQLGRQRASVHERASGSAIRTPTRCRRSSPATPDYETVKQGYLASRAVGTFIASPEEKWLAVEGTEPSGLPQERRAAPRDAPPPEDERGHQGARSSRRRRARSAPSSLSVLKALTPSRDEAEERARKLEEAKQLVVRRGGAR